MHHHGELQCRGHLTYIFDISFEFLIIILCISCTSVQVHHMAYMFFIYAINYVRQIFDIHISIPCISLVIFCSYLSTYAAISKYLLVTTFKDIQASELCISDLSLKDGCQSFVDLETYKLL